MQHITDFFNSPAFTVFSGIFTTIGFLGFIAGIASIVYTTASGVLPALYRLGKGLSKRKIAIFAENDSFEELRDMLIKSGMFKKENIIKVGRSTLEDVEQATVILVNYWQFRNLLDTIISKKRSRDALIIYKPTSEEQIGKDDMDKINMTQNAIIANFRGRLLNDVLTSMITTG